MQHFFFSTNCAHITCSCNFAGSLKIYSWDTHYKLFSKSCNFDMEINESKNTRISQAVHYLKVSWILLLKHQIVQRVPLSIKYRIRMYKRLWVWKLYRWITQTVSNGFLAANIWYKLKHLAAFGRTVYNYK